MRQNFKLLIGRNPLRYTLLPAATNYSYKIKVSMTLAFQHAKKKQYTSENLKFARNGEKEMTQNHQIIKHEME